MVDFVVVVVGGEGMMGVCYGSFEVLMNMVLIRFFDVFFFILDGYVGVCLSGCGVFW